MQFTKRTSYRDDLRLFRDRLSIWQYGALFALLLVLPLFSDDYILSQATFVFIYGIVAMGMMLLVGYTGQISLGHAAFFAVGAYVAAVLQARGWSFLPAFAMAGTVSGLVGIIIGLPALRVKGVYLAMATLSFAFIVEEVIVRWSSVTRGNRGMTVVDPVIFGYKFSTPVHIYFLSGIVFWLVVLVIINVLRSRTGRALSALRDSDVAAESMGINLAQFKTTAFAISAVATGLAGALYAHKLAYISPEQFGIMVSVEFLMMIIIGGLGSLHGAVFGAMFFILLPQLIVGIKNFLPARIAELPVLESVSFGILVILFVMFEPRGLNGYWLRIKAYVSLFPFYRQGMFKRNKIAASDLIKH
jgi:branched-chain amino acid transport system permease protein